ncbi:glycyl-radical enzyme activating protein [Mollicutes bacterium LVI A0078]|nr:glycyl-radical enzyme activating protein [Mollicutes bacterium LVI A0075]WOO91216.1 glycyl-radical enzyme activating protein [Mollicutes bacterium LVI A0078]
MQNATATVFNVQRFTVHDGPGIRTEFFLKGCTLRCKWCGNPESYIKKPQVGIFSNKCLGLEICGDCVQACPEGDEEMFVITDSKIIGIDRDKCTNCTKCYDACPSDAMKLWGQETTVEEAMEIIRRDKKFYEENNGGVTISGGEALLHPDFITEVFTQCREEQIHTCVETALHVNERVLDQVLPVTDMLITDIKHYDSEIHKQHVGVGNEKLLENMKKVAASGIPMIVRIPIIPGFNDDKKVISEIGDFIVEELGDSVVQMQLLRFRPLGQEKYEALNMPYVMEITKERSDFEQEIKGYAELLRNKGINAYAGATQKIEM